MRSRHDTYIKVNSSIKLPSALNYSKAKLLSIVVYSEFFILSIFCVLASFSCFPTGQVNTTAKMFARLFRNFKASEKVQ